MTIVRPLDASASAVVGASGEARLRIGPVVFGESWRVRRMVVVSDSGSDTDARVYLNAEESARLVAGSFSGNRDFNETDMTLQTLDTLIVVWVEGTPGAHVTFLLQGTRER